MIIILISEIKIHPKVPEIEQMLSTAAAAENILLALNSLNYAGMWRTGVFALNKKISKYVEIVPLDLWYRFVFSDGQTFDYSGDEKSMEQEANSGRSNRSVRFPDGAAQRYHSGRSDVWPVWERHRHETTATPARGA